MRKDDVAANALDDAAAGAEQRPTDDPVKIRRLYELVRKRSMQGMDAVFLMSGIGYAMLSQVNYGVKMIPPLACMSLLIAVYLYRLRKYREEKTRTQLSFSVLAIVNMWFLFLLCKAGFWQGAMSIRGACWALSAAITFYCWRRTRNLSLTIITDTGLILLLFTFFIKNNIIWFIFLILFIAPCFILFPSYSLFYFKKSTNLYELTRSLIQIAPLYPPENFPAELYPDTREYKMKLRTPLRLEPIIMPCLIGFLFYCIMSVTREFSILPIDRCKIYFIILYYTMILIFLNEIRIRNMDAYEKDLDRLTA